MSELDEDLNSRKCVEELEQAGPVTWLGINNPCLNPLTQRNITGELGLRMGTSWPRFTQPLAGRAVQAVQGLLVPDSELAAQIRDAWFGPGRRSVNLEFDDPQVWLGCLGDAAEASYLGLTRKNDRRHWAAIGLGDVSLASFAIFTEKSASTDERRSGLLVLTHRLSAQAESAVRKLVEA